MTRTGKIARLPRAIREELNQRMDDGEPGPRLVEWLNGLPEVKEIMTRDFGGKVVTVWNLGEWRKGGFREWQALKTQERKTACRGTGAGVVSTKDLADSIEAAALATYEASLRGWDGIMTTELSAKLHGLSLSLRDVARLRRGQLAVEQSSIGRERLALDRERLELERSKLDHQKSKGPAAEPTETSEELSPTMSHEDRAKLVKQMFQEAKQTVSESTSQ